MIRNDSSSKRVDWFPLILILPTVVGVLLIDIYPFFSAFDISFHRKIQGVPDEPFVGFANYREVLSDEAFWSSFWTTLKWAFGAVAGQVLLGTSLALLLNGLRRGQRLATSILLIPWVTPLVVAALTCRWLLAADYGLIGKLTGNDWLGDPSTALLSVIATNIWKYYGFVLLIVLARLKTIPAELHEAARVDGSGPIARFFYITLPQLWDVLSVTVLLMLIWTFNTFDMVYLMTEGDQSTNVLAIEVYKRFYGSFNFGMAAATSVLMFIILFGFAFAYARKNRL